MNPNDDKRKSIPTISQLVVQASLEQDKPPLQQEKEGKLKDT
ncbi:MAG: hypothetical protein QNJ47_07700 [Nostocaceae cyanobacterium]|nr:hypothetical protein [Nostocaceae cyanobacterium]